MQDSVIMAYLASKGEEANRTKLARIREGTAYFASKGISRPSESDFAEWRKLLEATKPGHRKGTLMGPKTSGDWVNDVKGFYARLNEQPQLSFPDMHSEATDKEEPKTMEQEIASDVSEEERVVRPEEAEQEAGEVQSAVSTEGRDREASSPVDTDKPRFGRKPKNAADRRSEKMSIYLTPQLMADLRDLANYSQLDISDVVFNLIEDFTLRNCEILQDYREFLSRRRALR